MNLSGAHPIIKNTWETVLPSAARTTTQTVDVNNISGTGCVVILDMTVVGTGSVTLTIKGRDPLSGKVYTILTGAAVTTNSTNVYKVFIGVTAAANAAVSDVVPYGVEILVTANNANAATYSVSIQFI